jgi:uncharacterized protein (TIGR03437 family)
MVMITANAAPVGQVFVNWTGAVVQNSTSSVTTLTMPSSNTTVVANFVAATPKPALISAAGSGEAVPGGIGSIYGLFSVAGKPQSAIQLPWPTQLAGLGVKLDNIDAPLAYVSTSQINLQIPWELAGRSTATVEVSDGTVFTAPLGASVPGIFVLDAAGQGAILDAGYVLVGPSHPVSPGDAIQVYCTGMGPVDFAQSDGNAASANPLATTLATPLVTIGGIPATLLFSGLAPGMVGLDQINVLLPANVPWSTDVPIIISVNGTPSNTATIAIQPQQP